MKVVGWLAIVLPTIIGSSAAQATLIEYDFTVSGGWFDCCGTPFGMPLSPSLAGTITVDNTLVGAAAMVDFSLTTGSHTWTEAEFVGATWSDILFNPGGDLIQLRLNAFQAGTASMILSSNNTFSVNDGAGGFNACNGCVAIGQGTELEVPEPSTLALVATGIFGFAVIRRRRKAKAQAK